jgi:DNA-directed RNA polymerase specialized sigma subunit
MKTGISKLLCLRVLSDEEEVLQQRIDDARKTIRESREMLQGIQQERVSLMKSLYFGNREKQTVIARNAGVAQGNVSRIISGIPYYAS